MPWDADLPADSASMAVPNACHIDFVSALSFSGRFNTTVAIVPARETSIDSPIVVSRQR